MSTNIFEAAARKKLRFPSNKGELTAEQLFDLPLESKGGFDLDTVARTIDTNLKAASEGSFVSTKTSPERTDHALRLEIVKFVIADRLAENERKRMSADKAALRARLQDALARKQDAALENLSAEELAAQLAALDS